MSESLPPGRYTGCRLNGPQESVALPFGSLLTFLGLIY